MVKAASKAPAAPNKCPVEPLVLLTQTGDSRSFPRHSVMARASISSPLGVAVAWAFTYWTDEASRPAKAPRMARTAPRPAGSGAVT
eukprot:scaffold1690_cov182-Amphora_coffeaeformis.AAC.29